MKQFRLLQFLLFFSAVFALSGLFVHTVYAQPVTNPQLYCLAATCPTLPVSGAPLQDATPSALPTIATPSATVNATGTNQPCSTDLSSLTQNAQAPAQGKKSHHHKEGGFLSGLFQMLLTLFELILKTSGGATPCNTTIPAPTAAPSIAVQPTAIAAQASASGSIQFIDHIVAQSPGQNMSFTVGHPNNIQPGDILVAVIGSDYAHVSTTPTGWTLIRQDVKNAGHIDDLALQSYYRIVTTTEPTNYTWTMATGRDDTPSADHPLMGVDMYAFRGVDPTNPIFSSNMNAETVDPKAIDCPNVKGLAGGMLICGFYGDDSGTLTAPKPMTQTSDFVISTVNGDVYAIAYEPLTTNNDTGGRIAAWNDPEVAKDGGVKNGSDFSHAIVLQPKK